MKSNVRSLAALLLSASLSLGTFPVFAQENTAPEEETSTVTDSSAADAANEEALKGENDPGTSPSGTPSKPIPVEKIQNNQTEKNPAADSSDSSSDSSDSSDSTKKKKSEFVEYTSSAFDKEKNTLTCTFTVKKVPTSLAFQLNWVQTAGGDAEIDPEPASITVANKAIEIDGRDQTTSDLDGKYLYSFSADRLKDLRDGDVVVFTFNAYSGSKDVEIRTTSQVYAGKNATDASHDEMQEQSCDFELTSDWSSVSSNYSAQDATWTLDLKASQKPKSLSVRFESSPEALLIKDQTSGSSESARLPEVTVTVDGKEIDGVKTELQTKSKADSSTSDSSNSSSSQSSTKTAASTNGVLVTLPQSAVDAMTATSSIKFVLKLNRNAPAGDSRILADVDNGIHTIPYESKDAFRFVCDPVTGYESYNKNDQTMTINLTLKNKPEKMVLTFTQEQGTYLTGVKTVKVDGTEVKPEIAESTNDKKQKVYTVTFNADQVKNMKPDTKISAILSFNPPASGSGTEQIILGFNDGMIERNWNTDPFNVEKAAQPKSSGADTATQTNLYPMIGLFIGALVALGAFFIITRKNNKGAK